MEFARPVDSSSSIQPSFFDLLSQSNFESLLQTLLPHRPLFHALKVAVDLAMVAGFGGITSEVIYGLERRSPKGKLMVYLVTLVECHLVPFFKFKLKLPEPLNKIVKLLDLLVKLAYITSDSKSFSLLHLLTGISFHHTSVDVYERQDTLGKIIKTILIGGQLAVYLLQSGVFEKLKSPIGLSNPAPPEISKLIPQPHPNGFPIPKRAGICPCCLNSWKDPIVISSGYIFCSKCIKSYKTCPVTRLPISHLVPLFLT